MMRLRALSLAPLLVAGTAYAQAPGDVAPSAAPPPPPPSYYAPPPAAPAYATPPAAPTYATPPAAITRRWAIGLAIGHLGVTPDGMETADAQFHISELAVRYRASRRIELEVAVSGGREVMMDRTEGDLATGSVTLGLRYRFHPERRWGFWVMGGVGGTVVAPHISTAAERDAATRPLGMVGVGVERRFRRFALQAELRAIGMGPPKAPTLYDDAPVLDGGSAPPAGALPVATAVNADGLGGTMVTIGAAYSF